MNAARLLPHRSCAALHSSETFEDLSDDPAAIPSLQCGYGVIGLSPCHGPFTPSCAVCVSIRKHVKEIPLTSGSQAHVCAFRNPRPFPIPSDPSSIRPPRGLQPATRPRARQNSPRRLFVQSSQRPATAAQTEAEKAIQRGRRICARRHRTATPRGGIRIRHGVAASGQSARRDGLYLAHAYSGGRH